MCIKGLDPVIVISALLVRSTLNLGFFSYFENFCTYNIKHKKIIIIIIHKPCV